LNEGSSKSVAHPNGRYARVGAEAEAPFGPEIIIRAGRTIDRTSIGVVTAHSDGECLNANSSTSTEPLHGWGWATWSVNTLTADGDYFQFQIYGDGDDDTSVEGLAIKA
jgi:hypothetical protein